MNKPVAVITGASAGIGKEAARALLAQGWRVIGTGRNAERCEATERELGRADFTLIRADMSLLADSARMAEEIAALAPRIDALMCNAGGVRDAMYMSSEGHEATFAANHLAHFLLVKKLMPQLKAGRARVISTSSDAHEYCPAMNWDDLNFAQNYSAGAAYCQAKLANVLFALELAKRGAADGITSNAIHPGPVTSNFWSHGDENFHNRLNQIRDTAVTPQQAAKTLVWLASAPETATISGQYFFMGEPRDPSAAAMDEAAADRLWKMSEIMVTGF